MRSYTNNSAMDTRKKTGIDISDQKLKKVLGKLKIEQPLLHKMEGQEVKEESDDDNNTKAFDFVIDSQKREVKFGKEGCKKGESDKSVREVNEKEIKENGGFMRTEEENPTEISEENRNKSWNSNAHKIKETDSG